MDGEWLNQAKAGVKRGLARGRRCIHRKRAGTDSLQGREGLGRAGWGEEVSGRGQWNGTGKGQQAQPSASSQPSPHITTAASTDALHVIFP